MCVWRCYILVQGRLVNSDAARLLAIELSMLLMLYHRDELPSASTRPSCFTILRDPVERAISFYYERAYPFYQRAINDFTPQELESLIREFYGSAWSKYRDEVSSLLPDRMIQDSLPYFRLICTQRKGFEMSSGVLVFFANQCYSYDGPDCLFFPLPRACRMRPVNSSVMPTPIMALTLMHRHQPQSLST